MHRWNTFLLVITLTCLGQEALGSEIINGQKAQAKKWLYMASVQRDGKHKCGGFLVSNEFVLTAAHCYNETAKMSVVLGTHNIARVNDEMKYSVAEKCKHPSYVKYDSGNDIMLLKLSKKAKLSKTLKTIQLPSQGEVIKVNTKCEVAGWGYIKTKGKTVDELLVVKVPTIGKKVCQKEWKNWINPLPAHIICAGGYEENGRGACQGDSGGPLVCNGKAVGIVSFNLGGNCDYPNVPNIYTDVSKFLPWIKKILKKKTCVK